MRTGRSRLIAARIDPTRDGINGSVLDRFLHGLTETRRTPPATGCCSTPPPTTTGEIATYDDLLGTYELDAFVLTGTHYGDPRTAGSPSRDVPFVTFGRPWGALDAHPWVDVDGAAGTAAATRHLLDAGHRRIAFLGWPVGSGVGDDRRAGWRDALRAAGVDPTGLDRETEDGIAEGERLMRDLLDAVAPSAVVCASDSLALGALAAAIRGVDPPVVGDRLRRHAGGRRGRADQRQPAARRGRRPLRRPAHRRSSTATATAQRRAAPALVGTAAHRVVPPPTRRAPWHPEQSRRRAAVAGLASRRPPGCRRLRQRLRRLRSGDASPASGPAEPADPDRLVRRRPRPRPCRTPPRSLGRRSSGNNATVTPAQDITQQLGQALRRRQPAGRLLRGRGPVRRLRQRRRPRAVRRQDQRRRRLLRAPAQRLHLRRQALLRARRTSPRWPCRSTPTCGRRPG